MSKVGQRSTYRQQKPRIRPHRQLDNSEVADQELRPRKDGRTPADILALQRSVGNRATRKLIGRGIQRRPISNSTVIQRSLTVTGSEDDIGLFLQMLSAATGLDLVMDNDQVTIRESREEGAEQASPTAASQIAQIINQGVANISLSESTALGAYPPNISEQPQIVNVKDFWLMEEKSPGFGAAGLIHEIIENAKAQHLEQTAGPGEAKGYDPSHDHALAVEGEILGELGEPVSKVLAESFRQEMDNLYTARDYGDFYTVAKTTGTKLVDHGKYARNEQSSQTLAWRGSASQLTGLLDMPLDVLARDTFATASITVRSANLMQATSLGNRVNRVRQYLIANNYATRAHVSADSGPKQSELVVKIFKPGDKL